MLFPTRSSSCHIHQFVCIIYPRFACVVIVTIVICAASVTTVITTSAQLRAKLQARQPLMKVEVACCSANAWVCVCLAIPHVLTAYRRLPQVSLGLELAPTCDVQADLGSLPSVFILGTQKAARANPRPCACCCGPVEAKSHGLVFNARVHLCRPPRRCLVSWSSVSAIQRFGVALTSRRPARCSTFRKRCATPPN